MIFDTHAHYDDRSFDEDRDELLASLKDNGVGTVINVGASWRGCEAAVDLSHKWDFIYAAVGLHPDEVGCLDDQKMEQLKKRRLSQSVKSDSTTTMMSNRTMCSRSGLSVRWSSRMKSAFRSQCTAVMLRRIPGIWSVRTKEMRAV